ncbi:MAG TPA: hypothetical protein VGF79_01020 [Bacteroidia bacterium]
MITKEQIEHLLSIYQEAYNKVSDMTPDKAIEYLIEINLEFGLCFSSIFYIKSRSGDMNEILGFYPGMYKWETPNQCWFNNRHPNEALQPRIEFLKNLLK